MGIVVLLMPLTQDDKIKYKDLYMQTAREYVAALRENVNLLETQKLPEVIEVIHRSAHSLKSQSAMMDYAQNAELSHALEDVFAQYKNTHESISAEVIETTKEAVEALAASVESVGKEGIEKDLSDSTQKLRAFYQLNA